MTYTFDESIVSDLHKDAYGFRPSNWFWTDWKNASDDQKQKIWDDLVETLEDEIKRQREDNERATTQFEQRITDSIAAGAGTRQNAIRWILQGEGLDKEQDYGYVCYQLDLPFSFEKEFEEILK